MVMVLRFVVVMLMLGYGLSYLAGLNPTRVSRPWPTPAANIGNQLIAVLPVNVSRVLDEFSDVFKDVSRVLKTYSPTHAEQQWWQSLCEPMWKDNVDTRIQVLNVPGRMNMLVLCWNRQAKSPVHSHGGSQCFIKVLNGKLKERVFTMPPVGTLGGSLSLRKEHVHPTGSVSFMNDNTGLHEISSDTPTVTLHVYIPGYRSCYAMPPNHADTVKLHDMHYQAYWDENESDLVKA